MIPISIDFDGTIAREGAGIEPGTGEPLPGALDFMRMLAQNDFSIIIFSLTASYAKDRIENWMSKYLPGISVQITHIKPLAIAYLDNRAIRYEGTYPTLEYLKGLK